nr:MAG TPA: hypothetical protein [Caudoviricetes sp.]
MLDKYLSCSSVALPVLFAAACTALSTDCQFVNKLSKTATCLFPAICSFFVKLSSLD